MDALAASIAPKLAMALGLARPTPRVRVDDRENDVRRLRGDRAAALGLAHAWVALAAEHRAAGRPAKAARALAWAAFERRMAARCARAAELRAGGMTLFQAMSAAGLHTGAG